MPLSAALLDAIAGRYGSTAVQCTPLPGGTFTHVYEYFGEGRPCILRITPPNAEVDLAAMRSMLEWLAYLAGQGGPVSRPLRSLQGSLIEKVEDGGRVYLAVAFEKASGKLADTMALEEWSDELFQALGESLGACHRIAQGYRPPAGLERPAWDQGANCFNPLEELQAADEGILAWRERALVPIRSLPQDGEGYGLAHLDLHFGNFFVEPAGRQITLFDFDDCAYGWFGMDIAMLLADALVVYEGQDARQFGERFLRQLLRGYLRQKSLSAFWAQQIPFFLKLLEIGLYIMIYRQYEPENASGWAGKFMLNRKERIEQETPYVELDFEAILEERFIPLR